MQDTIYTIDGAATKEQVDAIVKEIVEANPAFPFVTDFGETRFMTTGLSKRELFAAMALQGLLSDPTAYNPVSETAEHAVEYADALIDALAKNPQQ